MLRDDVADIWRSTPRGTRKKVEVSIRKDTKKGTNQDDSLSRIGAWVLQGLEDGPRVLVCAGVHGDEYEGPRALQELSDNLNPEDLRGCLVIVPDLNEGSMLAGKRCHPEDGKNLARVFPGDPKGSISERIAHFFVREFLQGADFFIDLHSASSDSRILPWAGYQMRQGEIQELQRRMAIAFGLDIVWSSRPLPGRTLSAAGDLNIPAIYVEMPGEGRCRREDVDANRRGVTQVLAAVGMIDGPFPTEAPPWLVESVVGDSGDLHIYHKVAHSGLFYPQVSLGDTVVIGDLLGTVVDIWGEVLCSVVAEVAGLVVHLRTFPTVEAGTSVVTIMEH